MSTATDLLFSQYQVDKVEARLVFQMRFIDRYGPFASAENAKSFQDVFELLERRLAELYKRHDVLCAEIRASSESSK